MTTPLREQHKNDAVTTLNGSIDSSQTSITATTGSVFPSAGNFRVMVDSEIMICTARSSNTLTVVRGQDGTTGASHADVAPIAMSYSQQGLSQLFKDADGLFGYSSIKPQGRLFADDGATILALSDFTWNNQGGASAADEDGTISLLVPTDSGRNTRILERSAPSTPYTYIGAFTAMCGGLDTDAGPCFGMGFRESSSGKLMFIKYDSASFFGSMHSISTARFSDSSTLFTVNKGPVNIHLKTRLCWFKIENDGTNTNFYVGPDGIHWVLFLSEGKTTWFSGNPDKVFWFGTNTGNSGTGYGIVRASPSLEQGRVTMATAKLGTIDARPSNIILGGDDIAAGTEFDKTVEDVLSFTETVEVHGDLEISAATTISLVDQADFHGDRQFSLSSVMTITDTIHVVELNLHVADALGLSDLATQQLRIEQASSVLSLTDEVEVSGDKQLSGSSPLGLTDTVEIEFAVSNQFIEDVLDGDGTLTALLEDFVNLTYEIEITDTLALTDEAARIIAVIDTLSLVQSVSHSQPLEAASVLDIEDTVEVQLVLGRTVSDDLGIFDTVTFFIDREGSECQYTPFIGDGDGSVTPPSSTPPVFGTATLTLTYPFTSPTTTLVLRNPDFGNQRTLNFIRVARESRGGTLEVYADPVWPKTKVLKLTVSDLTQDQTDDFLDFLADSLGKEVGLLDWENTQWRGLITTPDAEVTDNGRCKKVIAFEFEGDIV